MLQLPGIGGSEADAPMRLDSNPLSAIFAASFAAGPVLLVWYGISLVVEASSSGSLALNELEAGLSAAPSALTFAFIFGAMFTCLPNAIGSITLGLIGAALPTARSWPLWLTSGAIGAWLIALCVDARDLTTLVIFPLTGASCAAICRHFTRWAPL